MDSSISSTFVIRCCNSLGKWSADKIYVIQTELEINVHIRACQSPLPVASTFPAGLRSIEMTARTIRRETKKGMV
jgi:hypothetical protein